MQVAQLRNATLYHARMDVEYRGQIYQMHFFKTITAEKHFLETLQKILFLMTILGFFLALLAGFFVSRRILQPIRENICISLAANDIIIIYLYQYITEL